MPKTKYDGIYQSLRREIEAGNYLSEQALPSESQLIQKYECSRNTVRRAIAQLAEEGYVQSVHGKGVLVLYRRQEQTQFSISGIESMKEAAARNGLTLSTRVVYFTQLRVDEALSHLTGFAVGEEIYCVQRVRFLDGEALILDHNYFLKRVVRGLTPTIAEGSVYEYMEQTLGESIVTTRRRYTVERTNDVDGRYIDMKGYNCMTVVSSQTFNKDGVQFEFTQSRHRPDRFVFYELAHRKKAESS